MTLGDEHSRSKGVQYGTGEEHKKSCRENEEAGQSKNDVQL